MKQTLLKQAEVAGSTIVGVMRNQFIHQVDAELKILRDMQIQKMDERLADFRKKILANTTISVSGGVDIGEQTVSVRFACTMDQLKKECGL